MSVFTPELELNPSGFNVQLTNFSGPFDLLLQLIAKHQLDITEVALSVVTDEFISHIKALQTAGDASLDKTSQFLVVAATLLDLKTARLLPQGEVEDPEDLALLEARDLLFARLLQYRAFKQVSGWISQRLQEQSLRYPRPGGLEERFAKILPEVDLSGLADQLAYLAARAITVKEPAVVSMAHLHIQKVSVPQQMAIITKKLQAQARLTFRDLIADAPDRLVIVGRFLALLELFRSQIVSFEQLEPLGELTVHWQGVDVDLSAVADEYDQVKE
ncbi:MAG: segregation/condensation protein A [Propionibacteriaceae bacterium]|nr:segregation/condensation protein A [Propionibacteriaceae bacterium]